MMTAVVISQTCSAVTRIITQGPPEAIDGAIDILCLYQTKEIKEAGCKAAGCGCSEERGISANKSMAF